MKHLFLQPHSDDACLFGSFTLQRYAPDIRVLTVYESHVQGEGTQAVRDREDNNALGILATPHCRLHGLRDSQQWEDSYLASRIKDAFIILDWNVFDCVWAPEIYAEGHAQHNQVGRVGVMLGIPKVRYYHTYVRRREGKIHGIEAAKFESFTIGEEIATETDVDTIEESRPAKLEHITNKLRALACYKSQIERPDNCAHFLRDQREWVRPE